MKKVIVEHKSCHFNENFERGEYYVTKGKLIVLCTKTTHGDFPGVVVAEGSETCFSSGYTSDAWNGSNFTPFTGKITIQID